MSGSKLKYQLLLRPQIELLLMPSTAQVPDMNAAPILATEENLRFQPFLERVGSPPFAGDHRVVAEMPPEIIGQVLWSPVYLPLSKHIERFTIEQEDASWPTSFRRPQSADIDAFRPTMNGMGPGVAGAFHDLFRLDDFDDFGFAWIRFGIDDMNARRAQSGDNQVTPLDVRMRSVWTKRRAACVPAEVVQLIAGFGHIHLANNFAVGRRLGIYIYHHHRIGASIIVRVERRDVGQALRFSQHCQAR